jgi:Domain of unknown function (DUF4249)
MRKTKAPAAALALALLAAGCELTDVTTEPGQDLLVVEAVLRTDVERQEILLHRTLAGRVVEGEPGATVTVTDAAGTVRTFRPGGVCARIDPLYEEADSLDFRGTCYTSDPEPVLDAPWVVPGGEYTLRVETPRGEVAAARTVVPGFFTLAGLPDTGASGTLPWCTIPPETPLPLAWSPAEGTWSYVAQATIRGLSDALAPRGIEAPEPLELRGISVSQADTTIVFPTEFGVFERFEYEQELLLAIREGLPEGVLVNLAVAAAERNWVNGVRGGSFNPSGPVRVSSVVGDAVGVFGALVVRRVRIDVTADVGRRCPAFASGLAGPPLSRTAPLAGTPVNRRRGFGFARVRHIARRGHTKGDRATFARSPSSCPETPLGWGPRSAAEAHPVYPAPPPYVPPPAVPAS